MKDLDALVSTNPLQLGNKPNVEVVGETEDQSAGNVRFNDNRSMWSERRSVLTSFTGGFYNQQCLLKLCLIVIIFANMFRTLNMINF